MMFRPELAALVMAGRKTVTRRVANDNPRSPWYRGSCALTVGKDYSICPGRGKHQIGRAIATSVDLQTLGHLSDVEARAEGFPDAAAFEAAFAAINGSYDPDVQVWRIGLLVVR
jgi:hypothetical protein